MSAPASDVTRRRILLVDDDPTLRETLAEQLGFHEEYTVGQAENGAEAIKAIDADHFDAIVLDVGLPDMDGPRPVQAHAAPGGEGADHHADRAGQRR